MRADAFKRFCWNSQILSIVVSRSATFETGEKTNLVSFAPSCFSMPVVRHFSRMSGRLRDGFVFERGEDAFENPFAVVAAEQRFTGAFGMGHQAGHVAAFAANAGNVLKRTVRIRLVGQVSTRVAILPENLVVCLELRQRFLVGKITAFAVGDGNAENFIRRNLARERRVGGGGLQENVFAMELQVAVADECAGQESGFGQNLETV